MASVKKTLRRRIWLIANDLNIPQVTVENVIRKYLESLADSVISGEDIVIDNIMSIKVIRNTDGSLTARGRVSPSLRERLNNKEED